MDFVDRAIQYAYDILDNKISSCVYVKQACQRFVNDFDRDDFIFDIAEANRWCGNIETFHHVKGKWAVKKEKLSLSPYQIFCFANMYGWKIKATGRRRFRESYIEVPRKNGKTFAVVPIGLGHLTWDNEPGAEVYCGATTEHQAYEVFRPACLLVNSKDSFREKYQLTVNKQIIFVQGTMAKFEPLIGNPGDGASPSCGIADEYHQHKTSALVDTLITGMGARENPMMIYITTAGFDTSSPCYEKRQDVINILSGIVQDDSIFGIIYTIDEGDEWDTVEAQIKANPNYGISVDPEFLAGQLLQARRSASKQSSYKTKHLNIWTGSKSLYFNTLAYQKCRVKNLNIDQFAGRECVMATDLASKKDFACRATVFAPLDENGKYTAFVHHYLPEMEIEEGMGTHAKKYRAWFADGWIDASPGNTIDFARIEEDIYQDAKKIDLLELAYDPYQATDFAIRLALSGIETVEYGQTVKNLSEPMKFLDALILEGKIEFTMDPVLFWMFGNVTAKIDKKENVFPNKDSHANKIDGVVAIMLALGRHMHMQKNRIGQMPSNYKMASA